MAVMAGGINHMPGIIAPGDVHVIQPGGFLVSESPEQPSGVTVYPTSSTVVQCGAGRTNIQKPVVVNENPAGVTGHLQSQPTGLPHPAGMTSLQIEPGMIQYAPGTTIVLPPGDPQNPLNAVPGPTYNSNQPQWNMSFASFSAFDPKKFINEEVRTLGAIQILIGLMHIFSGIIPLLYTKTSVTGISGYLFWGGISFIVSGSLSVCAEKTPNTCMVNGSIGMNIVSAIFSLVGILVFIIDMSVSESTDLKVLVGGILPFALLEFFITCVVSHFGCKANCWVHFEKMTLISAIPSFNTANMNTGPVNATTSPVNTTTSPAYPTTSPAYPTTSPAYPTTGPDNPTSSLASRPSPDNVPPEPSRQNTAGYAQS